MITDVAPTTQLTELLTLKNTHDYEQNSKDYPPGHQLHHRRHPWRSWRGNSHVRIYGEQRLQNLSVHLRGTAHREQHRVGDLSGGSHRQRGRRTALLRRPVVPLGWVHLRTGPVCAHHQQTPEQPKAIESWLTMHHGELI